MNEPDFQTAPLPQRPRTSTVVGLLVTAAAILSYLGAYAMTNALVAAEVFKPWPRDHDPRFKWFLGGFVLLVSLFMGIGAMARYVGAGKLRQIEQMEQEAEQS